MTLHMTDTVSIVVKSKQRFAAHEPGILFFLNVDKCLRNFEKQKHYLKVQFSD